MRSKCLNKFFLFSLVTTILLSCSKYDKLLKSTDYAAKYEYAIKYYQKGDYFRSSQLLSDLITVYRGTDKAETIYYYYAYSHFNQEDYLLASYHFKNYVKTFPNGKYTEECAFMVAKCYFLDSPIYSLDQTNTYKAIEELQIFINTYPNSKRIPECNEMIDQLRAKLERKSFEISKLYYEMEEYESAIISFQNTLKDFPETKRREEIYFLIFKSSYLLYKRSIEAKKENRLKTAEENYINFVTKFPESKFRKEADGLYKTLENDLQKLKLKQTKT